MLKKKSFSPFSPVSSQKNRPKKHLFFRCFSICFFCFTFFSIIFDSHFFPSSFCSFLFPFLTFSGRFRPGPVGGFARWSSFSSCRSPQVYVDAAFGVIAGYGWWCSSFARFCRVKSWCFHGTDRCDTRDEVCLGRDDNFPPRGVGGEHSPNSVGAIPLPDDVLAAYAATAGDLPLCTSTVPVLIFSLE